MTTSILFTNARVFDGSGRVPFDGEILVEGKCIAAVGDSGTRLDRNGADVVDCAGATVMPGLVESHAHLSWPSSIGRVINAMRLPPEEHLLVTARNARITLDSGYTSAFSAGSLGLRFEIALREEINGGWIPGPRLRSSCLERAPAVTANAEGEHRRGAAAMREYVKEMADQGIDSIKFQLSSDDAFKPGGSRYVTYTDEEVEAIGAQARASNDGLSVHTSRRNESRRRAAHRIQKCSPFSRLPHPSSLA